MLEKPASIASNEFKSEKWDELTEGRNFQKSDIPILSLLITWYEVLEKCKEDMDYNGELMIAYTNQLGDVKSMPQISTMKTASAEIRALNKQLGINDEVAPETKQSKRTPLNVIMFNRQSRAENRNSRAG